MTLFLTKVWGFLDPCGPLQFSQRGWRENARLQLKTGDRVIVVGTGREPTQPDDRGRVLGMMEPSTEPVSWLDFDLKTDEHSFDDEHQYRWPYGLLNRRAWKFPAKPHLTAISDRRFSMNAALGIVPLTDQEAQRVLNLGCEEVALRPTVRGQARLRGEAAARRRGAPPPAENARRGIMHMRRAPAHTYAMEIEGADIPSVKIGWAFDYRDRQRSFNLAALPAIGGVKYRPFLFHLWSTAKQAFKMEQALLRRFDSRRHPSNREVIHGLAESELEPIWRSVFDEIRHHHP